MCKKSFIAILFLLFLTSSSFAGSSNGWIYQNPYPTDNTLLAVKFVTPKKGWVVGEKGIILYTEDGGENWEAQEGSIEHDLKSISCVNEKTCWIAGNGGIILHTEDSGKTWLPRGGQQYPLNKVFFLDDKEGWAAGVKGTVLHTNDGGVNWKDIDIKTQNNITGLSFINSRTGWLLAGKEIYSTKDAGKSWKKSELSFDELKKNSKIPKDIWLIESHPYLKEVTRGGDIFFIDAQKGWLITKEWAIFHTSDGGKTWKPQYVGYGSHSFGKLIFVDQLNGCAVGSSIMCTQDGGKTWQERPDDKIGKNRKQLYINDISFINQTQGWAAGGSGAILQTGDGGRNWKRKDTAVNCGINSNSYRTFFINEKTGWLHGITDSKVCVTNDGGKSWQQFNTGISISRLFFTDESNGWAVGWEFTGKDINNPKQLWGVISNTIDGGKTWSKQFKIKGKTTSNIDDGIFDVFLINPKNGWAAGGHGAILYTKNGGKNWEYREVENKYGMRSIQFIDENHGIAIADTANVNDPEALILVSGDGGVHWQKQWQKAGLLFSELYYTDKDTVWITGSYNETMNDDYLLASYDGGITWKEQPLKKMTFESAFFLDKDKGVLFTETGNIIITKDRGKNWVIRKKPLSKTPWNIKDVLK